MGKLEDAIKALERYEKNPTPENQAAAAFAVQLITQDIQKFGELCQKFTVRVQAEKLGWLIVENLE